MGFFDDALSAMGQSLAQSASGYVLGVTGPVVGNMLGTLFGGGQQTGGANLAKLNTDIQNAFPPGSPDLALLNGQMAAQTAEIQNIGNQLTALSSAVAAIQSEVSAMAGVLGKIAQEQLFQAWQTVDIQMTVAITSISSDYSLLAGFATNYANTDGARVATAMENLQTNGPLASMNLINALILGGGGESQGVLQLWSAMVSPLVQTGLIDYREAVDQYTAYYKKLVGAQLLAANVLVEMSNYFAIKGDHTEAMKVWNAYKACVLAQEDEFIQWLVPLVYSGVVAYAGPSAASPPGGPLFTYYEASMQLHAGLQAMPGDVAGQGYYAPTSIFKDAEALLASLSVTDVSDRRIVVHMVFSDDSAGTFKTPIDATPITIQLVTSLTESAGVDARKYPKNPSTTTGVPAGLSAQHTAKFPYSPFPVWGGVFATPDKSFQNSDNGDNMYLYRQVYSCSAENPTALPDGSYTLTDLNGVLPPLFTYAGGSATHFQEAKVLAHLLTVSPTSQFDFMNFGGYMVGQVGSVDNVPTSAPDNVDKVPSGARR